MSSPQFIEKDGKKFFERYGFVFPAEWLQGAGPGFIELKAWAEYHKIKEPGKERYKHLRDGICFFDERMRKGWNDWTETMCWAYANYSYVTAMGCTSSTKTHTFHILGTYDFISSFHNTTMTCTTTNSAGLDQRMWPVVAGTFALLKKTGAFPDWRTVVSPQKILKTSQNETKHVIRAVTIEEKADEQAIIDQLIGVHAERRIWIVDEATSAPVALDSAWANAMASTSHRRFIKLGNPNDYADALAVSCRPAAGWDSLDEDTEKWEFEYYGEKGIGLHFKGSKSPNIIRGKKANGEEKWPFLYDNATYQAHLNIKDTDPIAFHRFSVGWFMPEGISKRVCSQAMIDRHKSREHALFRGDGVKQFLALDPAFGGDRCILKRQKMGYCLESKRTVMDQQEKYQVPINPKKLPGEQIGQFVQKVARDHNIDTIGIDTTTSNSAVAEWLTLNTKIKVIWISFGGAASDDRTVSPSDDRICKDAYYNFAAELAFSVANNLQVIRGLDEDTILEMCSRYWEPIGEKPTRQKLETKSEYKARMKMSPDNSDTTSVSFETFRQLGGLEVIRPPHRADTWNKFIKKKNSVLVESYRE